MQFSGSINYFWILTVKIIFSWADEIIKKSKTSEIYQDQLFM